MVYLGGFWCALVTPDTAAPSYGLDADETPVEPQAQHATHGLRIGFNVKRDVLQAGATAADKVAPDLCQHHECGRVSDIVAQQRYFEDYAQLFPNGFVAPGALGALTWPVSQAAQQRYRVMNASGGR